MWLLLLLLLWVYQMNSAYTHAIRLYMIGVPSHGGWLLLHGSKGGEGGWVGLSRTYKNKNSATTNIHHIFTAACFLLRINNLLYLACYPSSIMWLNCKRWWDAPYHKLCQVQLYFQVSDALLEQLMLLFLCFLVSKEQLQLHFWKENHADGHIATPCVNGPGCK